MFRETYVRDGVTFCVLQRSSPRLASLGH